LAFKDHVQGYEMNQYDGLNTDKRFPQSFADGMAKWGDGAPAVLGKRLRAEMTDAD
jgi:hypothetical protein